MLLTCYGHAISVITNMVMEMSWPLACHGHGQSRGQNHDFCQTYSKGYISGQGHGDVRDKDSGQGHEVLKIMNLVKIMAWPWYGVGHGDGHGFGWDHGQDIWDGFFMVADNVHSYSYRLFPVIRKDSFRSQPVFLGQDLQKSKS